MKNYPSALLDFENMIEDLKTKEYFELIPEIGRMLDLEEYTPAQIEALIINATVECFCNDKEKHKIDITLMSLGLLKGFDNRPRNTDRYNEKTKKKLYSDRTKKFIKHTSYIYDTGYNSFAELEMSGEVETKIKSLQKNALRWLKKLSAKIYYEKDNKKYLKESVKRYGSTNIEYIPEAELPDLFYYKWLKEQPKISVGYYIKLIRSSEYHDEFSHEIYATLCHEGESPYSEWVATWLLKCIRKKFKRTLHDDIMLASFALLPGYELNGKDGLKYRLAKYLEESIYLEVYPTESYQKSITGTEESLLVMKELENREQEILNRLIQYIEDLPEPRKHIADLGYFGVLDPTGKKYTIKKQSLHFSKRRRFYLRLKNIAYCICILFIFASFVYENIADLVKPMPVYAVNLDTEGSIDHL